MDLMTFSLDRANGTGLYRQLTNAVETAISRGDLRAGERLPSERDLAASLGVSRTTVVNAYQELEARGLVRGHVGRGTFVCAVPGPERNGTPFAWRGKIALGAQRTLDPALRGLVRAAADPKVISFAAGVSALDCFPTEEYRETSEQVLCRGAATALGLAPTEGQPRLRRVIGARRGIPPERVLILAGAQQGLDLIARCLLDPGDTVVMDRPGYLGAIQTFRSAGAHIIGWGIEQGDLDELNDLILRYRPKLLYTAPTFQNPTGGVMPTGTRHELLDLAARHRLPVIEDDPYRELFFDVPPPPPLAHLDDGNLVIHIGTFSKTLAGGLRLGWLTASEAVVDHLALIKQRSDVSTPSLTQLVVADLITGGHFDAHLRVLRAEHARRKQAMSRALNRHIPPGSLTFNQPAGGLNLWCRLSANLNFDAPTILQAATADGIAFATGDLFYPDNPGLAGRDQLRLCFTANPPARMEEGIRRLASLLTNDRLPNSQRLDGSQALM